MIHNLLQSNRAKNYQEQNTKTYLFRYLLENMNVSLKHLSPNFFLSNRAKTISMNLWEELFIAMEADLCSKSIGYEMGAIVDISLLGSLGMIIQSAESFEDALDHIVQHINRDNEVIALKTVPKKEGVILSIQPSSFHCANYPISCKHFSLMLFGAIKRVFELVTFTPLVPLAYEIPNNFLDNEEVADIFEGHVSYSENKVISMLLSYDTVGTKIVSSDPVMLNHLLRHAQKNNNKIANKWTRKVERILHNKYSIANVGLYVIAMELLISERSLQRYLNEEGTTFKEIKQKVRLKLAKFTLVKTQNVYNTARSLGFPNAFSFNKSFLKWSGVTAWSFLECA